MSDTKLEAGDGTERPELIFALVGAAGTRLEDLSRKLTEVLESFCYDIVEIRLSNLLANMTRWVEPPDPDKPARTKHLQKMGNTFRSTLENGAALSLAAITQIRRRRMEISGSPDKPANARAYILHQLKHPDEVSLLRRVYGSSFYLIAGHATTQQRIADLSDRWAREELQSGKSHLYRGRAIDVITADEKEEDDLGQNTRDTYPHADFFANLGSPGGEHAICRFVDLLFGHPFHTPQPDEYAMYQAAAVSLRSSDDTRQVGAAIFSLNRGLDLKIKNADLIAVGMNEVPRGGGGSYWDQDTPDHRDQRLLEGGRDRAAEIKESALAELLDKICKKAWLTDAIAAKRSSDLAHELLPSLKRTQFSDIGEFSRPVHAEMGALIDAARRGVAVDGHSMYVTTFPCHNCAKHIISAGIRRVVYLEPYPKSRAEALYGEEMVVDSTSGNEVDNRVVFFAFTGVSPCQYRQLFAMSERGAKKGKSLRLWQAEKRRLVPLYVQQNAFNSYLPAERQELENLATSIYNWNKSMICPAMPGASLESKGERNPRS